MRVRYTVYYADETYGRASVSGPAEFSPYDAANDYLRMNPREGVHEIEVRDAYGSIFSYSGEYVPARFILDTL